MMDESTKGKLILVVEDEGSLLNALHDKLASEGFKVLEAKDGKNGLDTAISAHPDLILIDLVLPVMDGMTMLRELRAKNEWGKTVPVIILTNLSSADDERNNDVAELAPTYYLVKADWKIQDVMEKIKDRLGMTPTNS